jgi:hypothetical protein
VTGPTGRPVTGPTGKAERETVRFVAGPSNGRLASPASEDLYSEDDYGRTLLASLIRAQLAATLSILLPAAALLSLYPLLAVLFPWLAHAHVLGVPLTLLVLGGGIYPPLVLLGFWYVRRSERLDQRFADLLRDP